MLCAVLIEDPVSTYSSGHCGETDLNQYVCSNATTLFRTWQRYLSSITTSSERHFCDTPTDAVTDVPAVRQY